MPNFSWKLGAFEEEESLVLPLAQPLKDPLDISISVVLPAYYEKDIVFATSECLSVSCTIQ
jgi:hypothetical protein